MTYQLVVDGVIIKESDKIIHLKREFYEAFNKKKDVRIIRKDDGKQVWFNGKVYKN